MALNFRSLLTRTLTAAVFVAVLLSCICWNYYSFSILFLIVTLWGLFEFYKISELLGAKPFKWIGYLTSLLLYISIAGDFLLNAILTEYSNPFFSNVSAFFTTVFFGITFLILLISVFSKHEKPITNAAYTLLGVFYCTIPFYLLNKIALSEITDDLQQNKYNSHIVLGMILLIWANDSFAY